jgi:hypothetical protein
MKANRVAKFVVICILCVGIVFGLVKVIETINP